VSESQYDLIVIGGGPAGYVGAIRAAQLGMNVVCVERDALGGVCLNWGCIPTKALLAGAEFYRRLTKEADEWGIHAENISHDWSKVIARSRNVAGQLNRGVGSLFKKNKITHVSGFAKITKPGEVAVHDDSGEVTQTLTATNIMIATGARPKSLPFADFDHDKIIDSRDAMVLPEQPKRLAIGGAGAIGTEYASFYDSFGTEVTVIEMMDRIVPIEDEEVSKMLARSFKKYGIQVHTGAKTTQIDTSGEGVKLTIAKVDDETNTQTIEADKVLLAIGVRGLYGGLFDADLGIQEYKDHIKVDPTTYQTDVAGIYAVGDVIGPPWLAHVASEEAVVCVERIAGHEPEAIDYDSIPACTYCVPQVASVGRTEKQLKDEGMEPGSDYHVGKFPFQASGKAQAEGHTAGFVKILSDPKYGEILGVHMIGEHVTELIAELGLAKRAELTADEVIGTIHAHPTLSEAVHEAALGTEDRMIHF